MCVCMDDIGGNLKRILTLPSPLHSHDTSLIIISDKGHCVIISVIIRFHFLYHSFILNKNVVLKLIWCMVHEQFMQNRSELQYPCPVQKEKMTMCLCVNVLEWTLFYYTTLHLYILSHTQNKTNSLTLNTAHLTRLGNMSFLNEYTPDLKKIKKIHGSP